MSGQENGASGAVVTLEQIYAEVRGSSQSLTRMEERMKKMEDKFDEVDQAKKNSNLALQDSEKAHKKIDEFIKADEKRRQESRRNTIAIFGILVTIIVFITPALIPYYVP